MRARIRNILVGTLTTSLGAGALITAIAACGEDDPAPFASFDIDAANDANDAGSLADASEAPRLDAASRGDAAPEPVICSTDPCAVELVAGEGHFCARMRDSTVRCWGDDVAGQLGRGKDGDPDAGVIVPVVNLSNVVQISAAGRVTCALLTNGAVTCWGSNALGELGLELDPPVSDEERHPTPAAVALGDVIATRVDVGYGSVCATLSTGKLACWGDARNMKLARPDASSEFPWIPLIVGPGTAEIDANAFAMTVGSTNTMLALTKTGEVLSWGAVSGNDGMISGRIASKSPDVTPKRLEALSTVTSLSVSPIVWREPPPQPGKPPAPVPHAHGCAIADGEVFCWGVSFTGALCTGLPDREPVPKRAYVTGTGWPQQIAVGDETSCIRMTDGTVQCCGENTNGALGRGVVTPFGGTFAAATAFTSHAVHVAASNSTICALVQGGTVECWGGNTRGELGLGPDTNAHPSPTKITF